MGIKGAAEQKTQPLIPKLPDEIAELCLYRLPYPYQAEARSVSKAWDISISSPSFLQTKNRLSLSLPYLFVSAYDKSNNNNIQWQAFDPRCGRWFILSHPMPSSSTTSLSFSCASIPRDGKLYVFGATGNTLTYSTSTNQWSQGPTAPARAYSTAGNIGGKIVLAGGNGKDNDDLRGTKLYDPQKQRWMDASKMRYKMEKYDSAVMGGKLYVTEGWRWPFMFTPRGQVYDMEKDVWMEMSKGMREGWTGTAVVVANRLVVISEHGDCQLKVYQSCDDTWKIVGGDKFRGELLQRPFAVCGGEGGLIYVVSSGLNVVVGRLFEDDRVASGLSVHWNVLESPAPLMPAFTQFSPFVSQLLYA